ncbi:MAG: DUF6445 family protein [Pseudomonadota bacterium]
MQCTNVSAANTEIIELGKEGRPLVTLNDFLADPDQEVKFAALQKFAAINPYYPGIRAPLAPDASKSLSDALSSVMSEVFDQKHGAWGVQAWYSIVTSAPQQLMPIQRLPHVDGTAGDQIALMVYLHHTDHGGTGFYRHEATGFESLSDARYPTYKQHIEREVAEIGLPPAAYITDGAPLFSRIHAVEGVYNRAILYHGNSFHSGIISNDAPLPADALSGRLTVNAFMTPPQN